MVSKKVESAVGRNEEIGPGTTLITSSKFLSQREPFRLPPGTDFDVIGGVRGPYFVPLQAVLTS